MFTQQARFGQTANLAFVKRSGCTSKITIPPSQDRRRALVANATVQEEKEDRPFNIDKAVVLGAAAFGAYIAPDESAGTEMNGLDGTDMRFFDSKFVQENYDGVLEFSNISAKVVTTSDWTSKSDVYITAELGDAYARTDTKWNNENPVFDNPLDIWVPKGKGLDNITIRVFDDDYSWFENQNGQSNEDDPLGSAKFKLSNLKEESNKHLLEMTGQMSGECVVTLTATYLPFGTSAGDEFLEEVDEETVDKKNPDMAMSPRAMQKAISAVGQPLSKDLLQAWEEMCTPYSNSIFSDKRTIAYISNNDSGTQAWVSRDMSERKVLVSFRGTETSNKDENYADIFTDLQVRTSPMVLEDTSPEGNSNAWSKWMKRLRQGTLIRKDPRVHTGFLRSYLSVRERILRTIDACTGGSSDWHIYITGHSLGGALATMCAWELGQRKSPEPEYYITMYTYGGPRVGNEAFVELFNVPDSWRVHNENDLVAQVPPAGMLGYRHVETGVRMLEDGSGFRFTNALNEDVTPNGLPDIKWSPHNIMARMDSSIDEWMDTAGKNMEMVNVLRSGDAISSHLEDVYAEGLTTCMEKAEDTKKVSEYCVRSKECIARSRSSC